MANKSMGEIISTLRREKGMTQKELADMLNITDKTMGESFWVYDIPASDFIITQSTKEKKLNICGMAIKETVFILPCLKHCNELKKYISENFQ